MIDSKKPVARIKKLTAKRRRRAILGRRFCYNVCRWPWAFALAVLVLIALMCAMSIANVSLPGSGNLPVPLVLLWNFSSKLAILIIFALAVATIFTSPPSKALLYEASLYNIEFTDHFGNAPALVACHKLKSANADNKELIFYSSGIEREQWEVKQESIQDALEVTYLAPPAYEYKRHCYIRLTVTSGIAEPQKEPLYDDEL